VQANDTRVELLARIDSAFQVDHVFSGRVVAESMNLDWDEGLTAHFLNTHWKDHSADSLDYWTHALTMFSPTAVSYFLPAFLSATVAFPGGGAASSTVDFLCPPKGPGLRPSFAVWWSKLTKVQRAVTISVLAWPGNREDPLYTGPAAEKLRLHLDDP
jgi:hypothetical protein